MAEYIVNPDEWLSLRKEDINEKNCEPIVRCKDCSYSYIEEENGEVFRCCDYWYNEYSGYGVKDDDFCSQGERWVED